MAKIGGGEGEDEVEYTQASAIIEFTEHAGENDRDYSNDTSTMRRTHNDNSKSLLLQNTDENPIPSR